MRPSGMRVCAPSRSAIGHFDTARGKSFWANFEGPVSKPAGRLRLCCDSAIVHLTNGSKEFAMHVLEAALIANLRARKTRTGDAGTDGSRSFVLRRALPALFILIAVVGLLEAASANVPVQIAAITDIND